MCAEREDDPTDEIEITSEMVAAGALALSEFDCRFEGPGDAVSRVYAAMEKIRRSENESSRSVLLHEKILIE
jgi:hypothetical protein